LAAAIQEDQFVRLSRILNISILTFFGLLAVFSVLLLRGVLRPLRELQDQLVAVAQDGPPRGADRAVRTSPELRDVGPGRGDHAAHTDPRGRSSAAGRRGTGPAAVRSSRRSARNWRTAIPSRSPGSTSPGVQEPAEGVLAGDWWSAQVLYDGQLAIALTDVSGHGPEAGMEALRLKHVLELSLAQNADPALALSHAASGFRTLPPASPRASSW
jgi:hypothetical protein